jgi:hypothetical protein
MPQQHGDKVKVPVLLSPEQYGKVKAEADRRGVGVGTLIRMIVIEHEGKAARERKEK